MREAAKQGEPVPTVEWGSQAYPLRPGQMSSSGCGPYLTPSSHPVLQPALLSHVLHITGMCVPLAPLLFACSVCLAFALCFGGGIAPSSLTPSFDIKEGSL